MKPRLFGLGASAVLLAGATWVACGSETSGETSSGGADAGGGTAGTGGPSWGGGGAAAGGGGSGASGGSAGDGGIDWGADPKWEPTGQMAAGCTIEQLKNADEVKAFVWKPCAWAANCEEATFNPKLVGADPGFSANVHDDGMITRIALAFTFSKIVTVVSDSKGSVLTALRGAEGPEKCVFAAASLWGNRFAVVVTQLGLSSYGGILGESGAASESVFTLVSPPPGSPQRYPLAEKRWLWWWAPASRFSTVSAVDGSDFTIFAKEGSGQTALLSGPTSAGSIFLFDEFVLLDGGDAQRRVSWSDGKLPPAAYLTPPVPADDLGFAAFADTHVGVMRGINRKDINKYDTVEVWASPFSADPAQLKPELVAKLGFTSTPELAGGHGVLAALTSIEANGEYGFTAWNVMSKQTRGLKLPAERVYKTHLGISREHVYLDAAKPNAGPSAYLVRYPVP
ncbi:MAG: hypothetical protein IPI67_33325 [Myxococcales bacterium]|nr:hypothetical protein [Myxococcales bacterium]